VAQVVHVCRDFAGRGRAQAVGIDRLPRARLAALDRAFHAAAQPPAE